MAREDYIKLDEAGYSSIRPTMKSMGTNTMATKTLQKKFSSMILQY